MILYSLRHLSEEPLLFSFAVCGFDYEVLGMLELAKIKGLAQAARPFYRWPTSGQHILRFLAF